MRGSAPARQVFASLSSFFKSSSKFGLWKGHSRAAVVPVDGEGFQPLRSPYLISAAEMNPADAFSIGLAIVCSVFTSLGCGERMVSIRRVQMFFCYFPRFLSFVCKIVVLRRGILIRTPAHSVHRAARKWFVRTPWVLRSSRGHFSPRWILPIPLSRL